MKLLGRYWILVTIVSLLATSITMVALAQVGAPPTAEPITPWVEIVRNLGVPTVFLGFFTWYHLQRTKSHEAAITAKDNQINKLVVDQSSATSKLVADQSAEVARINKEHATELSRVNELRVKEAQENANRLFARDKESMALLAEADKTLTILTMTMEKFREGPR